MNNQENCDFGNHRLYGYGDGEQVVNTPEVMRDCIKEHCWEKPVRADLFKTVGWLADDFKRRGFKQQVTLEIIQEHLTIKFGFLKPEALKQIKTKVTWVYEKQEHGLTCTGALDRGGMCHRIKKSCRYHEIDNNARQWIRSTHPVILPADVKRHLDALHPTDTLYAACTYLELLRLEHTRNLLAGNPKEPIFIGFRSLAIKVTEATGRPGYDKHCASKYIHLLEDAGFIKTVVRGSSGSIRRKANGYIRIVAPISPKYNSEPGIGPPICVQDPNGEHTEDLNEPT